MRDCHVASLLAMTVRVFQHPARGVHPSLCRWDGSLRCDQFRGGRCARLNCPIPESHDMPAEADVMDALARGAPGASWEGDPASDAQKRARTGAVSYLGL
jgi:hypothetical protein